MKSLRNAIANVVSDGGHRMGAAAFLVVVLSSLGSLSEQDPNPPWVVAAKLPDAPAGMGLLVDVTASAAPDVDVEFSGGAVAGMYTLPFEGQAASPTWPGMGTYFLPPTTLPGNKAVLTGACPQPGCCSAGGVECAVPAGTSVKVTGSTAVSAFKVEATAPESTFTVAELVRGLNVRIRATRMPILSLDNFAGTVELHRSIFEPTVTGDSYSFDVSISPTEKLTSLQESANIRFTARATVFGPCPDTAACGPGTNTVAIDSVTVSPPSAHSSM